MLRAGRVYIRHGLRRSGSGGDRQKKCHTNDSHPHRVSIACGRCAWSPSAPRGHEKPRRTVSSLQKTALMRAPIYRCCAIEGKKRRNARSFASGARLRSSRQKPDSRDRCRLRLRRSAHGHNRDGVQLMIALQHCQQSSTSPFVSSPCARTTRRPLRDGGSLPAICDNLCMCVQLSRSLWRLRPKTR